MYLTRPGSTSDAGYTLTVEFGVDRDYLFDLLSDLSGLSRFSGMKPPKRLDTGSLGVNSQWATRYGPLGLPLFKSISQITVFNRPHDFTRLMTGDIVGESRFVLSQVPGGTRLTVTYNFTKVPWLTSIAAYEAVLYDRLLQLKKKLEGSK